jgi:hypothetical protein
MDLDDQDEAKEQQQDNGAYGEHDLVTRRDHIQLLSVFLRRPSFIEVDDSAAFVIISPSPTKRTIPDKQRPVDYYSSTPDRASALDPATGPSTFVSVATPSSDNESSS